MKGALECHQARHTEHEGFSGERMCTFGSGLLDDEWGPVFTDEHIVRSS